MANRKPKTGTAFRCTGTAWRSLVVAGIVVVLAPMAKAELPIAACDPITPPPGLNCMQDYVDCGLNCTANDVLLTLYNVIGTCSGGSQDGAPCVVNKPLDPCVTGGGTCISDAVSCINGEELTLNLQAEIIANANERYDIGIYVALDGGDALSGVCLEQYLNDIPLEPGSTGGCNPTCSISGAACLKDADCPVGQTCDYGYDPTSGAGPYFDGECTEDPGDTCGDLEQGVTTLIDLPPITVTCQDADGNGFLDIGTATSWDQQKSDGGGKPSCHSQLDTLPGSPAKCNVSSVQVGTIAFLFSASIEVVKDLIPSGDSGLFDLQIDSADQVTDVGDGGTTGAVLVYAGETGNPGSSHTVGETAGTGTSLAGYTTTISCVDRGTGTFDGGAPLTFNGAGPLNVPVDPDDDIVCTVTNTNNCEGVTCDDGNDCTDDVCDPILGCQYTNDNTNSCSDGDNCTNDVCIDGTCQGSAINCSAFDGECTVGVCNQSNGQCEAQPANEGGACTDDGNSCTDDVCAAGACVHNNDDTNSCSDGVNCTNDACVAGGCVGTPIDCSGLDGECTVGVCNEATGTCQALPANEGGACTDDGLPCTDDVCAGGVCTHPTDDTNTCSDGDPCTDDACVSGTCAGTPIDCSAFDGECTVGVCNPTTGACEAQAANEGGVCTDDGNPCTDDVCQAGACVHNNDNTNACSDGVNCTDDACVAGACVGTPIDCSFLDGECTVGVCNESSGACEAAATNEGGPCSDEGNECTDDVCESGACVHNATPGASCTDDGNDCTDDLCDAAGACTHPAEPSGTVCSGDGIACTIDECDGTGACVSTPDDTACDDGMVCTTEFCDATLGCQYDDVPNCCTTNADCVDTSACTDDICNTADGTCSHPPIVIDCSALDGECTVGVCDPASGLCTADAINEGGACSDDGLPCTDDVCQAGVCVHNDDDTNACSDGVNCTDDACVAGACVSTPIDCSFLDGECTIGVCNESTGTCEAVSANEGGACTDDGNPCTDDVCEAGVCVHINDDTNVCSDGDACTNDACLAGACIGTPVDCSALDGDCTVGVCNPSTGQCQAQATNEGGACTDDGNACTDDVCQAGVCTHPNNDTNMCTDGDNCTDDACVGGTCVGTAVDCSGLDGECTVGVCNATTGQCEAQSANEGGACTDDGNPCTDDVCEAGACAHNNDDTNACSDGDICTTDACVAGGCVGTPIDCSNLDGECTVGVCNAQGQCVADPANEGGACTDDGNPCTDDVCAAGSCVHNSDDTNTCTDGVNCTNDACVGGTCMGTPIDCSSLNGECVVGVCNENNGTCEAQAANEGGACTSDGNPCTDDVCVAGACAHNNDDTNVCNDGDACTSDACVAGGCAGTPITCNDNNACTDDSCNPSSGCVFTDISGTCDDGNACTTDSCNPATGCVNTVSVTCNDNDRCTNDSCSPSTGQCVFTPNSLCFCGNDVRDPGEECDGTDDNACPGECTGNCKCRDDSPTVSEWGMISMLLLLLVGIAIKFGTYRPATR